MSRSDDNNIEMIFATLGVLLLVGFGVWIMKTFDVSFAAASSTSLRLLVWGLVVAALIAWHFYAEFNVIKNTTPLIVSFFGAVCSLFLITKRVSAKIFRSRWIFRGTERLCGSLAFLW